MKKAGDHEIAHEVRGGQVLMRLKNKADGQSFGAAYQGAHSAQRPSGDHVGYHLQAMQSSRKAIELQLTS